MERLTQDVGGYFVGAPKLTPGQEVNGRRSAGSDYPAIDGWYVSQNQSKAVPISLKETSSASPSYLLTQTRKINEVGADFSVKDVTLYADAPNMSAAKLMDFARGGPLAGNALNTGVVNTIVVKTAEGYVTIESGRARMGLPDWWKK